MPKSCPPEFRCQVIELARAGTKVKQLAKTFAMSDATIYNWPKQDRIDRREAEGATTSQQLELAAARRRIKQLETELAVARKGQRGLSRRGRRPKRLYPVIRALTGQSINVQQACLTLACRNRAPTPGRTDPTRRGRCGGSGWPARSPTSTRSRAALTARCGSRPSSSTGAGSTSGTARSALTRELDRERAACALWGVGAPLSAHTAEASATRGPADGEKSGLACANLQPSGCR